MEEERAAFVVASDCEHESCFWMRQGCGLGSGALLRKLTNDCFGSYYYYCLLLLLFFVIYLSKLMCYGLTSKKVGCSFFFFVLRLS